MQKIVDDVQFPELIDDGQQTAPSKRIIAQFPQYNDLKTTVGTQVAERIGLENIRSNVPTLKRGLIDLRNLERSRRRSDDD